MSVINNLVIPRLWVWVMCTTVVSIPLISGQYRNDRDPEYFRYGNTRRISTPNPLLYNSGDTYHGTDRRQDTRYDDKNRVRGFDNKYDELDPRYRGHGGSSSSDRYDARGRQRPGYDGRDWRFKGLNEKFGVLSMWRPDLQGEQRPGEIPGQHLPLAENVFVSTDSGKVQGFYVYLYDKPGQRFNERPVNKDLNLQRHIMNVTVFLGIPYARPPINEGRFKPPRRVPNWYKTWQGLDFSPACPQNIQYTGTSNGVRNGIDEDCLTLNIYTPSLSANARDRYPVMLYIHGGDFDHGASSQFPAHMLSAWGEVVVVTINYRLGALGFLSTGDDNSPGNYGLMDMARALEWVHSNIRFFNGNKDRITLFGPGAGAAAAGILAVIPKTRDYVSQVIAESGSALADWATIDDVYRVQNTSRKYGLEVGCSVENSHKLLECLNRRNYEELALALLTPDLGTFAWAPVVDTNFTVPLDSWYEDWESEDWHILPELPKRLYEKNLHHPNLKYLAGVNRDEAANFIFNDVALSKNNYVVTEDYFNGKIKEWVKHYNYSLNPEGAFDAIKWMYTFWPDPHNTTHVREQYIHMLSDALYKSGVDELVKLLVNTTSKRGVPTYYYLLNTTVDALKMPLWREVPHNIEYYFLSGAPFMDPEFYPDNFRVSRQQWSEGDRNISEFMMKTFINFAKWGNPTHEQVDILKVKWEPVLEGTLRYLSINTTFNTSMHYNYRQTQASFWFDYMPRVIREWLPTPPPPKNPWIEMNRPLTATMYAFMAVSVVLSVMLIGCCGLWKSARRQRNKALDDLQCYSTENLTQDNGDYDVKRYIEKISRNGNTRSNTPNTMISTYNTNPSTMSTNTNGKSMSMGQIMHSTGALTEPDSRSRQQLANMEMMQQVNRAASDDQLSRPIAHQHNFSSQPNNHYMAKSQQNMTKYIPPSVSQTYEQYPHEGRSVQAFSQRNMNGGIQQSQNINNGISAAEMDYMTQETYQPEYTVDPHYDTSTDIASSVDPRTNPPQPLPRQTYPSQQEQVVYDPSIYHHPPIPPDSTNSSRQSRPMTPTSITFDISMKPSRSTTASASGSVAGVLNTEL